jgi:hypothetical protein
MSRTTGKTIVGVGDVQGPSFAYLNLMDALAFNTTQSASWPGLLKANQLPKDGSLSVEVTWTMPSPALDKSYAGQFRLKWTGTGGIKFQLGSSQMTVHSNTGTTFQDSTWTYITGTNVTAIVSRSALSSSFSGRFPTTTNGSAALTYDSFDNVSFCLYQNATPDNATRLDGGELINPDFVAIYRTLNVRGVRTMDWGGANIAVDSTGSGTAPVTQWRYRTPMNAVGLANAYFQGPNTWAGNITGTDTYTSPTFPDAPASWTHNMTWQGYFSNTNTVTTPTISMTGVSGGAKPLVRVAYNSADIPSNNIEVGILKTDRPATFVYDANLGIVIVGKAGLTTCVPIEYHVALANAVECDLWSCFPHQADDDFITQTTTIVRNTLTYDWFPEYSNEMWNTGFDCRWWAKRMGVFLGFPNGNNEREQGWQSLRVRQINGNLIPAAWSPRSTSQLKRVVACQATAGTVSGQQKWKLEGFDLIGSSGNPNYIGTAYPNYLAYVGGSDPQYNVAGNRAIDFCEVLSYAIYYNGALLNDGGGYFLGGIFFSAGDVTSLTGAADAYNGGDTATAFAWLDADVRYGTRAGIVNNATLYGFASISNGTGVYPAWETVAATPGYPAALKVVPYEAAYQAVPPTTAQCTTLGISTSYSAILTSMLTAYKNSSSMVYLALDVMRQFNGTAANSSHYSSHGLLPHSDGANWFSLQGPLGPWSILSGSIYKPAYKSYDAIQLFNNAKRRLIVKT